MLPAQMLSFRTITCFASRDARCTCPTGTVLYESACGWPGLWKLPVCCATKALERAQLIPWRAKGSRASKTCIFLTKQYREEHQNFKHLQSVIIRETTPPKNKNYVEVVNYQDLGLHHENLDAVNGEHLEGEVAMPVQNEYTCYHIVNDRNKSICN